MKIQPSPSNRPFQIFKSKNYLFVFLYIPLLHTDHSFPLNTVHVPAEVH
jgi:hypothetical protein